MAAPRDVQGIVELASAFYGSAALFAALDCGVFAAVEKSGRLEDIAAETGCDMRGLRLLADACVAETIGHLSAHAIAGKTKNFRHRHLKHSSVSSFAEDTAALLFPFAFTAFQTG